MSYGTVPSTLALLPGPLVRASSWEPTAEVLRRLGLTVVVPEVVSSPRDYPAWDAWSDALVGLLPTTRLTLVGHSSATVLAAQLATRLDTEAIVFVDGVVPPSSGSAGPVPERVLRVLGDLCGEDGVLPPWSDWWETSPLQRELGITLLRADEDAYQRFRQSLPLMSRSWFDGVAHLDPWGHIPAAYLQLSTLYASAAAEAKQRGWPVLRLDGTHLHPTVAPEETASAIVKLCARLQSAP